jgi:hypothetical protein
MPDLDALADVLWGGALSVCTHHTRDLSTMPIVCGDHPTAGLLCEGCLLDHTTLKHTPPSMTTDIPQACTLCSQPIPDRQREQAQIVARACGTGVMRTAHDVRTLVNTTSDVLLVGHNAEQGLIAATYFGPIRVAFAHWLCDPCRNATPPETTIMVDISPP